MDTIAKPASSSDAPSSKASSTSVISVTQPDLEGRSSLSHSEQRDRKSRYPARAILGVFFVLLLLGMFGAGGYQYLSNRSKTARAPSSALKASSIKTCSKSSSRTSNSAPSEPSVSTVAVTGPAERVQSVISQHPRSVAAVVLAVVLAIALIATVVVLVKTLNAPPQIVETIIHDKPIDGAPSASTGGSVSPLAIGAIVAAVVFLAATIVVAALAYKSHKSTARKLMQLTRENGQLQNGNDQLVEEKCQLAVKVNLANVRAEDFSSQLNIKIDEQKESLVPDEIVIGSDSPQVLKNRIDRLFDEIDTMANSLSGPLNVKIHGLDGIGSPVYGSSIEYKKKAGDEPLYRIEMTSNNTPTVCFADSLRFRRSLIMDHPLKRQFLLLANSGGLLDSNYFVNTIINKDDDKLYFISVFLDELGNDIESLRQVMSKLVNYKKEMIRLATGANPELNVLTLQAPPSSGGFKFNIYQPTE